MKNIVFANPGYLYLLILIPIIIFLYYWKLKDRHPKLIISTSNFLSKLPKSYRVKFQDIPFVLLNLGLVLLIFALSRPQSNATRKEIQTEGVDIVIAVDVSTSMLAEDLKPNRIEAAKKTAIKFIENRVNDRIGLVVFSGESFTQCPITIDHSILISLINKIKSGMIEDGTAIGMGLATAISRLKDSKSKSKVIILLTDGINNMGFISPQTAAEIAKTFNIKVYTIGIGSIGVAPYPFKTPFGVQYQNVEVKIDEPMLKEIAQITSGKYFRAVNTKSLTSIYNEIDSMEKTKINVSYYSKKTEHYSLFLLPSLILIFISIFLKYTIFKRLI
jgi:Ca-activated chloride channel family protein